MDEKGLLKVGIVQGVEYNVWKDLAKPNQYWLLVKKISIVIIMVSIFIFACWTDLVAQDLNLYLYYASLCGEMIILKYKHVLKYWCTSL